MLYLIHALPLLRYSYGVLFIFGHLRDYMRMFGLEQSKMPEEAEDQKVCVCVCACLCLYLCSCAYTCCNGYPLTLVFAMMYVAGLCPSLP